MNALCFTPSVNLSTTARPSFLTGASGNVCVTKVTPTTNGMPTLPRACLGPLPPPGIPSGQDPTEGAPLRSYIARPLETYEDRSFATELPRTWEGEVTTIGAGDIDAEAEAKLAAAKNSTEVVVESSATSAFLEYSDMVREERKEALAQLGAKAEAPVEGRATCGEEEGRGFISNFDTRYLDGVKCVEYWGAPNGPVPRLFGGESA